MINDTKAQPPVPSRNSAGTKPSTEAPTSLLSLPTEVLTDVFAHAMTGNSAQALRQTSDLAVSHPALSAILAMPGPEQRKYQKLLVQRRIVQAICDQVPNAQRAISLMPLLDILPKAIREKLLSDCFVWLERPSIERHAYLGMAEQMQQVAYIRISFSMLHRLNSAQLTALAESAAAVYKVGYKREIDLEPHLSLINAATRGRVIQEAESNIDFARFLLMTHHNSLSTLEYNRVAGAVLSNVTMTNNTHAKEFDPDSVKKLNKENLSVLAESLIAGGSNHNIEASIFVSLLNRNIKLKDKETEGLCDVLLAYFNRSMVSFWDLSTLSTGLRDMKESVRIQFLPIMTRNLADWDRPYIAESLLHAWGELDEAQRGGLVDYIDSHMETMCAPRGPNTPKNPILIDRAPLALKAIIDKINDSRHDMAAANSNRRNQLLRASLEKYVTLQILDDEDTFVPLSDSLVHQEEHLVRSFFTKFIAGNDQIGEDLSRNDNLIVEFTANIAHDQLDAIFDAITVLPESRNKTTAIMELCLRSEHLDSRVLDKIVAWIIKTDGAGYDISPVISAIHLFSEQNRLSTTSRCDLALWCTTKIAKTETQQSRSLYFYHLAKIVARESKV